MAAKPIALINTYLLWEYISMFHSHSALIFKSAAMFFFVFFVIPLDGKEKVLVSITELVNQIYYGRNNDNTLIIYNDNTQ